MEVIQMQSNDIWSMHGVIPVSKNVDNVRYFPNFAELPDFTFQQIQLP